MKYNIYSIVALGLMMAGLTACDGALEFPSEGGEGQLDLRSLVITNDDAVKIVKSEHASRADGDENTDFSAYTVKIYKDGEAGAYRTYTYAEMPEIISLPAGSYTAEAYSHEVKKAAWEEPYFYGKSETFNIETGAITKGVDIECKFASVAVSVYFADDLKALMGSDVKVNVLVNDEGSLDFTGDETRTGHFEAVEGSNTMVVTFSGTVAGVYTTAVKPYDDLAAQQHRKITFKAKNNPEIPEQTGTIDPSQGITIDFSVIDEDVDGNITVVEDPIDAERPGKEDPIEDPKPDEPDDPQPGDDVVATFASSTLNLDGVNTDAAPESAVVNIKCPKGFAHVYVNISSDSDAFVASVSDMLGLSFDLAEPGDKEEDLDGLGFPTGEKVIGEKEIDFNITDFVPILSAFPGNHNFGLTIVDAEGGEISMTLKFKF